MSIQDALTDALVSKCRIATAHDAVLNSECAYTFHSPFTARQGIVVNLNTYMGTIQDLAFVNDNNGPEEEEGIFVRIVKQRVEKMQQEEEEKVTVNADKPTKLGVGIDGGFQAEDDKFEIVSAFSIVVLKKDKNGTVQVVAEAQYDEDTKETFPDAVVKSADSVILHAGMAVQQDLKAWELDDEPKPVSKYYENLPFVDNGKMISPKPADWKCEKSGDTENLWLNLSDGFIGGGRKNWDGSGGSNGALDHFQETGQQYPLVVKLGTITGDVETADCYSYAKDEDGPVKIPNLADLLEKRGINVGHMQKTVKSTAELEVELNATYAFDAITEAGAHLTPVAGPGLQGLQNLGNSCYMNSVAQLLLSGTIPELVERYGFKDSVANHALTKTVTPKQAPKDVLAQTVKMTRALTSGEFAGPVPESVTVTDSKTNDPKYRLQPRMFKHVIGDDHVDFSTGQQQDAAQFLQYLLEKVDRAEKSAAASQRLETNKGDNELHVASDLFAFKTTARLVCNSDSRIKYKDSAPETMLTLPIPMDKAVVIEEENDDKVAPDQKRPKTEEKSEGDSPVPTISFSTCLDSWAADTTVDDYRWPHLNNTVVPAVSQTRFYNFPRYLLVQIQRYTLGEDWTPKKLQVKLDIPQEIDLSEFKSKGPQEGENLVPEEDDEKPTTSADINGPPAIDEAALAQLMDMGFSFNGCKRALTAVGGSDVQAAMNWVFEHNMDPDFNDPLPETTSAPAAATPSNDGVDDGVVMSLVENLGCFTMDQVRAALKETNGAADRAADWLFSRMDDLDGAIAALGSKQAASSLAHSSTHLEDGEGKYSMIGMISHIGKHTGSGHYVAHLKKNGKWVIFNDEKVALSESPPFEHAYMYLFQRKDTVGSPINPNY